MAWYELLLPFESQSLPAAHTGSEGDKGWGGAWRLGGVACNSVLSVKSSLSVREAQGEAEILQLDVKG